MEDIIVRQHTWLVPRRGKISQKGSCTTGKRATKVKKRKVANPRPDDSPKQAVQSGRLYFEVAHKGTGEWKTAMLKSKRKKTLKKERVGNAETPYAIQGSSGEGNVECAKRAGSATHHFLRNWHVLEIHPNDDTISSDVTLNLLASKIETIKAKLALRGMRTISRRGVLVTADSTADLDREVAEVERSDLAKDHSDQLRPEK